MRFVDSGDVELRASLGLVKDYRYGPEDKVQDPDSNYDVLMDMFENDSVLSTAIDKTVETATFQGYRFIGENEREVKRAQRLFDEILDFDQVVDNVIYQLLIYGDSFLELRRIEGEIAELHSLETSEMKIKYDENGNVLGYRQVSRSRSKSVDFAKDDVIHLTLKQIGSRIYSRTPFKSIAKDFSIKQYSKKYISSVFLNFPPRLLYILKQANPEQQQEFIQNLRDAKRSPNKDLLAVGDVDVKETGTKFEFTELTKILNYLRSEILMITQVPPILLGIPDDSNRSNSDAQIFSFECRVKKIQQKIASAINRQLMPKLGLKNTLFRFNPVTLQDVEKLVNIAVQMKQNIGVDPDSVMDWLKKRGVDLRNEAYIEELDELMDAENPEDTKDTVSPSRQRRGNQPMQSDIEKGGSVEGRKKLDKKKTEMRSFNQYPYVYNQTVIE